jgi:3-oxoacyl-[acyl-carrier-protein] synthase III
MLSKFKNVSIASIGCYIPKKRFLTKNFDDMFGTKLQDLSGIIERRFPSSEDNLRSMAVKSCLNAINNSNVENIDGIIFGGVCKYQLEPAIAMDILKDVKSARPDLFTKKHFGYDMSGACAGLGLCINNASQLIEQGICENILVVGSENSRPSNTDIFNNIVLKTTDINNIFHLKKELKSYLKSYGAGLTFGSGSLSMLLSKNNNQLNTTKIIASHLDSIPEYSHVSIGKSIDKAVYVDFKSLTDYSNISKWMDNCNQLMRKENLEYTDLDRFAFHQMSSSWHDKIYEYGKEKEYVHSNLIFPYCYHKFGNIGSISAPLNWIYNISDQKVKKKEKHIIGFTGSGIVNLPIIVDVYPDINDKINLQIEDPEDIDLEYFFTSDNKRWKLFKSFRKLIKN